MCFLYVVGCHSVNICDNVEYIYVIAFVKLAILHGNTVVN